jgi:5-methylcytosine-specific restriction enzyme subunit McrC
MELFEFGEYKALDESIDLKLFKDYLQRVWTGRHLFYNSAIEAASEQVDEIYMREASTMQAFINFDGRRIQARNYVGFIHFNGVTIQLLPKLFIHRSVPTSFIFQHLLFYLSYCPNLRFPLVKAEAKAFIDEDWLQRFISIFAQYSEQVLSGQPYFNYENLTEELPFVRGKLSFPDYVRSNVSTGQWQHMHIEHSPFQYDNLFNQVVKYTVKKLLSKASEANQSGLQAILFLLNEVSDCRCNVHDCERIILSRLHEEHQQIIDMCKVFLVDEQLAPAESFSHNFAFLVPMERVFEEFVSNFMHKHIPDIKAVYQQASLLGTVQQKPYVTIRPDIWIPALQTVIDVKYKLLQVNADEKIKSVAPTDVYQMLAYALGKHCFHVHLLYPQTLLSEAESFTITIDHTLENRPIQLHIHQIPVIYPHPELFSPANFRHFLTSAIREKLSKVFTFPTWQV